MNCDFPKGSVLEPLLHLFLLYISDLKGTLSGLRQFLATESALKIMKIAFYFTSKSFFGHVLKRLY